MKDKKHKELDEQNEEELEQEDLVEEELIDEEDEAARTRKRYVQYGLAGAAVLVLLVGGWLLYGYYQGQAQEKASLELSRVRPYYEQGYYEAALNGPGAQMLVRGEKINGLRSIADNYGNTETGKLAALYAGNCSFTLNRLNDAEKFFDQAASASAPITRMGGLAGVAACKAQNKAYAEAAKLYEEAATVAEKVGDEDRFRLFAALEYEKAGQKDQALKLYRAIATVPEFSEITAEAKSGIVRLGGSVQ